MLSLFEPFKQGPRIGSVRLVRLFDDFIDVTGPELWIYVEL